MKVKFRFPLTKHLPELYNVEWIWPLPRVGEFISDGVGRYKVERIVHYPIGDASDREPCVWVILV